MAGEEAGTLTVLGLAAVRYSWGEMISADPCLAPRTAIDGRIRLNVGDKLYRDEPTGAAILM